MSPEQTARIASARAQLHLEIAHSILTLGVDGVPTIADKDNDASVSIAKRFAAKIGANRAGDRQTAQSQGKQFEEACTRFLSIAFRSLGHLRPGDWTIERLQSARSIGISAFSQYEHLRDLRELAKQSRVLAAALGTEYQIAPDVVISRQPVEDAQINAGDMLVDENTARRTGLRKLNSEAELLHAVVSCKWTIRSDRAQNSRTEALNLLRNRKGRAPHIVVITAEPLPSRLASIALGTGDIDCVYHLGLTELLSSVTELAAESPGYADGLDLLRTMVDGKRLSDVSDLPLDLAI